MTREQVKKNIAVITEFANGGIVQYKSISGEWSTTDNPKFSLDSEYRIKPEPREWWINEYYDGRLGEFQSTEEDAKNAARFAEFTPKNTIHVREVL